MFADWDPASLRLAAAREPGAGGRGGQSEKSGRRANGSQASAASGGDAETARADARASPDPGAIARRPSRRRRAKDLGPDGTQWAAAVTHELMQPIAAIALNGEACLRWLDRDEPNLEEARATLEAIIRDAISAGEMLMRVLPVAGNGKPGKR